MAITINAKGTTVPYFKIGKGGVTVYQGTSDPSASYTIEHNDVWIDVTSKNIRYRTEQNTWSVQNSPVVVSATAPTSPDYGTVWYDIGNTGRLYVWNNTEWVQRGSDIDGEASNDNSGHSVSLSSDGSIVAIGAPLNDGIKGIDRGHVRVYRYQ